MSGFPQNRIYYEKKDIDEAIAGFEHAFSQAKRDYPSKESVVAKIEDLLDPK